MRISSGEGSVIKDFRKNQSGWCLFLSIQENVLYTEIVSEHGASLYIITTYMVHVLEMWTPNKTGTVRCEAIILTLHQEELCRYACIMTSKLNPHPLCSK